MRVFCKVNKAYGLTHSSQYIAHCAYYHPDDGRKNPVDITISGTRIMTYSGVRWEAPFGMKYTIYISIMEK